MASCHWKEKHTKHVIVVAGSVRGATLRVVTERLTSSDDHLSHLRLMSRRLLRG